MTKEQLLAMVREVEEMIGYPLPSDYVMFQVSRPLGDPWRKYFSYEDPRCGRRRIGIRELDRLPKLAPFPRPELLSSIDAHFSRTRGAGLLPKVAIPIGSCWDDETVLLRADPGELYGTVHLKTYHTLRETDIDNEWDDIVPIASSFKAFLEMLEEPHPGDEQ
jgi:hypothetical protein